MRLGLDGNDVIFLAGAGTVAYGVWQIYPPAGIIALGLVMVAVALGRGRELEAKGDSL